MIYAPTTKADPRLATTRIIRRADLFNPKVPRMSDDDLPDGALVEKRIEALVDALVWHRDFIGKLMVNPHEATYENLVDASSRAQAAINEAIGDPVC